jgi:hypothetical protein
MIVKMQDVKMPNELSKRVRLHPSAAAERTMICTSIDSRAGERGRDNTSRPVADRVEAGQLWHGYPRDRGNHKNNRKYKKSRKYKKNSKHKTGPHLVIPGHGDPCPRCGVPMQIREHNGIGEKQLRQPFFYTRWFCCMNLRCKTTVVMPERYKVLQPVVLGDTWDDIPDASEHQY